LCIKCCRVILVESGFSLVSTCYKRNYVYMKVNFLQNAKRYFFSIYNFNSLISWNQSSFISTCPLLLGKTALYPERFDTKGHLLESTLRIRVFLLWTCLIITYNKVLHSLNQNRPILCWNFRSSARTCSCIEISKPASSNS
jgi:hypothetical protein